MVGTQKNRLNETILLSTHNIGFECQMRILEHEKLPLSRALIDTPRNNLYTDLTEILRPTVFMYEIRVHNSVNSFFSTCIAIHCPD